MIFPTINQTNNSKLAIAIHKWRFTSSSMTVASSAECVKQLRMPRLTVQVEREYLFLTFF